MRRPELAGVDAPSSADASAPTTSSGAGGAPLIVIRGVTKRYHERGVKQALRREAGVFTTALDDVSFEVGRGETLGLVGESGSGKTTIARALVGLVRPDEGSIEFDGREIGSARGSELTAVRRRMQLIYQDPYSSLNPSKTIGKAIAEPAIVHGLMRKQDATAKVRELLEEVGLPAAVADRRPRALSGGQRQRVAIARALAVEPEVLIADEAVSALDVSVQAQILRVFARLQRSRGLTLIFVSHQLATVAQLSQRVAIMYRGRLVEIGPTAEVFARPRHGYTAALLRAHPGSGAVRRDVQLSLPASAGTPAGPVAGCPFEGRCLFKVPECAVSDPRLREVGPGHLAACHVLPDDDTLAASAGTESSQFGHG